MRCFWQINKINKLLAALALAASVSGCSLFGSKDKAANEVDFASQQKASIEFEKANVMMDSGNYAGALEIYDRIIVAHPVTTLDSMIIFNAALSHLQLANCPAAEAGFRKVVRATNKDTPSLAIRAKLRLADALNCQGKEKEAMVLLLEINRDRSRLPIEIGEAELPAKIAAAYSRNGNRKMADQYFAVAELGLRKLQAQRISAKDRAQILAQTLFTMGDFSNVKKDVVEPSSYFQTLKVQQQYLLRAVEFDIKPWSQKAYDQLTTVYEQTWRFVAKISPQSGGGDPANRRDVKVKRSQIIELALAGLKELRDSKNLGVQSPQMVNDLYQQLGKQETKLNNFLVADTPGSEYTNEAMKLQAPRREGQVKANENTILERKAKKKRKP